MLSSVVVAAAFAGIASAGKGFTGKPVIAGYWPSYAADLLQPKDIQFGEFTHIDWFVAESTPTYELGFGGAENLIAPVVSRAKKAGVSVSLSIGGWTGSIYFSDLVANATGRATYAKSIKKTLDKYGFSGADLDWEFPGSQGIGCNTIRPEDADNFLAFLKVLRDTVGPDTRLSAAVSVGGILGADGNLYQRTGDLAKYLDYVTIMAYDIYGYGWSATTGPVGQLYDTCATDEGSGVSGALAVKLWTDAGFPAKKLLLGMPAYAYPYKTASSKLAQRKVNGKTSLAYQNRTDEVPKGGVTSAGEGTDSCGNPTAAAPSWLFKELISTGKLTSNGTVGKGGFTRYFDACSGTPFLFNSKTRDFIAYDDPASFGVKAQFARKNGLAGINMFDLTGDTKESLLINAARAQLLGESFPDPAPGITVGDGTINAPLATSTPPSSSSSRRARVPRLFAFGGLF
ncbi:family 18 glycoside hydrolase [Exidia glandulosa HHB12029]|uniref:Family 18 glycoside hydrolase n=1 Tax=Exidia glandulosa HHB12029 TaxID=1314781 RepID=A0A165F550_EXIGL|nr:family 18 glycoside hydrolase [Exidia glandulosa HHB12029]